MQLDNFDPQTSSTLLNALNKKPVGDDLPRLTFLQDLDRNGHSSTYATRKPAFLHRFGYETRSHGLLRYTACRAEDSVNSQVQLSEYFHRELCTSSVQRVSGLRESTRCLIEPRIEAIGSIFVSHHWSLKMIVYKTHEIEVVHAHHPHDSQAFGLP
jgi:hypothetical protein